MCLEPLDEVVHTIVDPIPVPEPVWCHSQVLDPRPGTGLVSKQELPWVLFGRAEEIRDSFWTLCLLLAKLLLEIVNVATVGMAITLVGDEVPGIGCHGLHKPGQYLIKVLIRLGRKERGQ